MKRLFAVNYVVVALLVILSSTTTYSYPTEFVAQQLPAYALLAEDDNLEPFLESQETIELQSSDGFEEFEAFEEFEEFEDAFQSGCSEDSIQCKSTSYQGHNSQLWWILGALFATIVAGIMVRFRSTRTLRGFFLLASLVILGFYVGGCPCPIMSLQHVIFAVYGLGTNWTGMLWFLGLIPVTYFFGKVWCGWICHLGALQEFLFLPGKIKVLQSEKAQVIMRRIRLVLLAALAIQILITSTNLFKTIDPFKVAFNLRSSNMTGWVLLGLIVLTSLFMYRPFCKSICPIGLILGWVGKIPGALVLAPAEGCRACRICERSCHINAITLDEKYSKLDNQECITCGNCVGDCRSGSMVFVRNYKKNGSKSICKND